MVMLNEIPKLIFRSMKRWLVRTGSEVLLVCITAFLFVIYAVNLHDTGVSSLTRIEGIETPYFDVLLRLPEGESPFTRDGSLRIRQGSYVHAEVSHILGVSGSWGMAEVIGIDPNSSFFQLGGNILGRLPLGSSEVAIPKEIADSIGLQPGDEIRLAFIENGATATMQIVGVYEENGIYAPLIAGYEELLSCSESLYGNAMLFSYDRSISSRQTLASLSTALAVAYPKGVILSVNTPQLTGSAAQSASLGRQLNLSGYLLLFMGIAIYTISFMTFLEVRKELASLKAIGISKAQLGLLVVGDTLTATFSGLLLGGGCILAATPFIPWLSQQYDLILRYYLMVFTFVIIITLVALAFPTLTALVASVNQLLFARVIPLIYLKQDRLDKPTAELVYREHEEGLCFLQLPLEGDVIHFKSLGDSVKQGEVITQSLSVFGLVQKEWISPCDGIVAELLVNGQMGLRPSDASQVRHAYSPVLLEQGREQEKRFGTIGITGTAVHSLMAKE